MVGVSAMHVIHLSWQPKKSLDKGVQITEGLAVGKLVQGSPLDL